MNEGVKHDGAKLRFDLIHPEILDELAKVLTYGAKKYSDDNWLKVEQKRYVAALYRHLNAWRMGEENDEESGFKHLSHAMCNLGFLLCFSIKDEEKLDI